MSHAFADAQSGYNIGSGAPLLRFGLMLRWWWNLTLDLGDTDGGHPKVVLSRTVVSRLPQHDGMSCGEPQILRRFPLLHAWVLPPCPARLRASYSLEVTDSPNYQRHLPILEVVCKEICASRPRGSMLKGE